MTPGTDRTVGIALLCKDSLSDLMELRATLQSFDEVIIADDGSTDGTVAYCRAQDYCLVDVSEIDSFGLKRLSAINAGRCAWMFMLDTDERLVDEDLRTRVDELVLVSPRDVSAWEVGFRTFFSGVELRHGGVYPLRVTRLFRRSDVTGYTGDVHERIRVGGRTLRSNLVLHHHSYRSVTHYISKINVYTTKEAHELLHNAMVITHTFPARAFYRQMRHLLATALRLRSISSADFRAEAKATLKNRYVVVPMLPLYPIARFLNIYLVKRGYRDGIAGVNYASLSAIYSAVKYLKFVERRWMTSQT